MFIVGSIREQMWVLGLCAEVIGTDSIIECVISTGWTLGWEERPWRDKWFIRDMDCREGGRERERKRERNYEKMCQYCSFNTDIYS